MAENHFPSAALAAALERCWPEGSGARGECLGVCGVWASLVRPDAAALCDPGPGGAYRVQTWAGYDAAPDSEDKPQDPEDVSLNVVRQLHGCLRARLAGLPIEYHAGVALYLEAEGPGGHVWMPHIWGVLTSDFEVRNSDKYAGRDGCTQTLRAGAVIEASPWHAARYYGHAITVKEANAVFQATPTNQFCPHVPSA